MEKKKKLRMPHAYTLIFMLIILVAIMTWIIPSGEFEREVVSTATGERTVAVAGTIILSKKFWKMEQIYIKGFRQFYRHQPKEYRQR